MSIASRQVIEKAKEKIKRLEEENRKLRDNLSDLSDVKKQFDKLQSDYNRLILSKSFGHSEKDKQKAYRRLTNMIVEIDRCITMLNN